MSTGLKLRERVALVTGANRGIGLEYAPAYSMSKTALNAFTRQLAAATKGISRCTKAPTRSYGSPRSRRGDRPAASSAIGIRSTGSDAVPITDAGWWRGLSCERRGRTRTRRR